MEDLPEEILHLIFTYLDNDSMCSAMKVSKRWQEIFSNSSTLMRKFIVNIENLPDLDYQTLPDVPVRNLVLQKFKIQFNSSSENYYGSERFPLPIIQIGTLLKILKKYENSLESLKFHKVHFSSTEDLEKSFKSLCNLKSLTLEKCRTNNELESSCLNLVNLESFSLIDSSDQFLLYLCGFGGLKEVTLGFTDWGSGFYFQRLNKLLVSVPTIKKLTMEGVGTASYFNQQNFHFQLESLQAYLTTFSWTERSARSSFFQSQVGYLKDLKLERLPYDYDGGEVLKFIIEKMKLERFIYGDQALILNGIKQKIDEVWFNEVQISSGMEMMRQFPSIKKLRLWLCATGIDEEMANLLLGSRNDLFANIRELFIDDSSEHCNLLKFFIGLYKNCRNIKKLKVNSSSEDLNLILQESLPFMTQLEEIHLSCIKTGTMQVIRDYCINLKDLHVPTENIEDALVFFGENLMIGEY